MKYVTYVVSSAAVVVLLAGTFGCSSSSGGGVVATGPIASFVASGTGASADTVRLVGQSMDDRIQLDVVITGPTTSGDLHAFSIELLIGNPTLVELVTGSATFGDALTLDSGQQPSVLASQSDDRITIGAAKLGGGLGNGVPSGEKTIVSLELRMLEVGATTLALDTQGAFASAAIDSTGATIGSVAFDSAMATISGI